MQNITVKSKEIRIKDDRFVIESENKAELVEFTVMDAASIEGLSDMVFYVQYRNKLEEVGMDILEKDVVGDTLLLDWLPSASFTKERGPVEIQIIGFTQSLVTTSDATYQSGKLYFDADGNFIPVYPADSTHSPKVGDTITGTVKENQETGDDHRWSTIKVHLFLPEDIYENGTPVYTEAQVESLITQIQAEIALAQGYATSAANSATAASGSASAASGSASSANTNALKAEGFAVGQQGGTDVTSGSPYYHNNAKYYSDEASASATAASASAGSASQSATTAVNAMIASVSETISPDDGGTNTITITYRDGTTKTFTVKNGKAGTPFEIYKTYASISAMNADFDNVPLMKMVCISSNTQDPDNGKLYVRGEEQFEFITDMSGAQGIQGPDGQAATIAVGTVSTGAAGSSATVTNRGTSSAAVFDFSIPKGDTGASGAAATIAVGTVTPGDDPSDASVTNSGTSSAAVFDFVLPKGETGNTPLLSIGDVTYGDTPTVTIDTTDPDNPVLDFVLKTSEVGVVDNLTSDSQVDALSAKQGKVLKGLIASANSRIAQHESRIENLEQKAGDYTTVQYRGTNAVPTGKAKYGLVKSIVGKTRAWNQLFKSMDSSSAITGYSCSYDSITNKITITNDSASVASYGNLGFLTFDKIIFGHQYLILGDIPSYAQNSLKVNFIGGGYLPSINSITVASAASASARLRIDSPIPIEDFGVGVSMSFHLVIRDLTVILPEYTSAQIEAMGISGVLKLFPDLAKWDDFDAGSLVSTEVSGIESKSKNLFNDDWFLLIGNWAKSGEYYTGYSNGNRTAFNAKIASDLIPKIEGKRITLSFKAYNVSIGTSMIFRINYTDSTTDEIRINSTTETSYVLTSNPNKTVMSFFMTYSTAMQCYIRDFQIELGDTATSYAPFGIVATLSLSTPVTLKSAGSVSEVLNLETGKKTRPIGSYTFTGNETGFTANSVGRVYWYSAEIASIIKIPSSRNIKANILCAGWIAIDDNHLESNSMQISVGTSGLIGFCLTKTNDSGSVADLKTYLQNHTTTIYFELATPLSDEQVCDPITDNFIEVQGGGTIDTIQEQTPVIDNCLDVGYLAL